MFPSVVLVVSAWQEGDHDSNGPTRLKTCNLCFYMVCWVTVDNCADWCFRKRRAQRNTLTELISATMPMQDNPQMILAMASILWSLSLVEEAWSLQGIISMQVLSEEASVLSEV